MSAYTTHRAFSANNQSKLTDYAPVQHYIFIASDIAHQDFLINELPPASDIRLFHSFTELFSQLDSALAWHTNAQLHIFCHGQAGQLHLEGNSLSAGQLKRYTELLAPEHLTYVQAIHLYACQLAKGEVGQAFVKQWQAFFQCPVYAATEKLGNTELGGHWEFFSFINELTNQQSASVKYKINTEAAHILAEPFSRPILSSATMAQYPSLLDPLTEERVVNTITVSPQQNSHTSVLADGSYVTVWQSVRDNGSWGIFAQRFSADGAPIGHEFSINQTLINNQTNPRIAGLTDGSFVVVWDGYGSDDSSGVFMRRFDANGNPLSDDIRVNEEISDEQDTPDIAALSDGKFVVVWRDDSPVLDGSSDGVIGRLFNADMSAASSEFLVNTTTASNQFEPRVDATVGGFTVTWAALNLAGGNNYDIAAQRFDNNAALVGDEISVSLQTGNQRLPDIAYFSDGGFVITWRDDQGLDGSGSGVYGQVFDSDGVATTGLFLVNTTTFSTQASPSLAVLDNDNFVITWNGNGTGDSSGIFYREFQQDGTPLGNEQLANSSISGTQSQPSVTTLSGNNFLIDWTDSSIDGSNNGVVQRLFGDLASFSGQESPEVLGFVSDITFDENTLNSAPQILDIAVAIVDSDSSNFDGGSVSFAFIAGGSSEDNLSIRNQGTGANQISVSGNTVSYEGTAIGTISANGLTGGDLVIDLNANANATSVEALLENIQYQNTSQSPQPERTLSLRLTDGDGGGSQNISTVINVTQVNDSTEADGPSEVVNTYFNSTQWQPHVSAFDDGGYLVTWSSFGQNDSSNYGIYGQRFSADGSPIGVEFVVNQSEFSPVETNQELSTSTTFADGSFMVVWSGGGINDSVGVYGRVFNADGTPQSDDFLINQQVSNNQNAPRIARLSDGNVAVVWQGAGNGDNSGVFARIFDANGNPLSAELLINSTTSSTQRLPDISAYNGGFVVSWDSFGQVGGNGDDIVSRKLNNDGSFASGEININLGEQSTQQSSRVAAESDGAFVVTWYNANTGDVFAQRVDAAGNAIGNQILVNENTGTNSQPDIELLAGGNFAVTWYASNSADVFRREFTADGTPIDSEIRVNTFTGGTQQSPSIAHVGGGEYVIVYQSNNSEDGSANSILIDRFGSFNTQADPVISGFSDSYTTSEAQSNAAPVRIEAGVSVTDIDSDDFDGGNLTLGYNIGGTVFDQLVVLNQGTAPGEIGINGSNVTFGGIVIGVISNASNDGTNGSPLSIDFNANASREAVEALLENIGHQNTSNSPAATRGVAVRLTDGDGGASANEFFLLNITGEDESTPATGNASVVNSYSPSTQQSPNIAAFDDGSYLVVWESYGQNDTSTSWGGIHAQRFNADGKAIGTELAINLSDSLFINSSQLNANAVTFADGSFIVAWEGAGLSGQDNYGIFARRFNPDGTPAGDDFQLNDLNLTSESDVQLTRLSDGNWAAVWTSVDASGNGVTARIFDSSGVALTGQFVVNTSTSSTQWQPTVSAYDGGFVVGWSSFGQTGGSRYDIVTRKFNNDGSAASSEIDITLASPDDESNPNILAASDGSFVITWVDNSTSVDGSGTAVLLQRVDATGNLQGSPIVVNETVSGSQSQPELVQLANGNIVVTWYSAQTADVFRREFDTNLVALDSEQLVNTQVSSTQADPAIAHIGNNNYVIAFDSSGGEDGSGTGILQRVFGPNLQLDPQVELLSTAITFEENTLNASPQLLSPATAVVDFDSNNFDGGQLTIGYLQGQSASDQLGIRNEGVGAEQIGLSGSDVTYEGIVIGNVLLDGVDGSALQVSFNSNATVEAVEALIENLTFANSSEAPNAARLLSLNLEDGDGGASGAVNISVTITPSLDMTPPLFDIEQVNTYTNGYQYAAQAASFADGSYVVAWYSQSQDDSGDGIYAQRFDANGLALGREYLVNTTTNSSQNLPHVATLTDGSFVIAWQGNGPGDNSGVFGQRFDANGVAVGNEFNLRISATNSTESEVALVGLSDGKFAAVWYGANIEGNFSGGIAYRLFNADGSAVANDTVLNSTIAGFQNQPDIAAFDGGAVVVWTSNNQTGGNSNDIVAQRIDNNGALVGGEINVSLAVGSQTAPQVAAYADGSFVVVWQDNNGFDGSGSGIYARQFNADGSAASDAILVNQTQAGSQTRPDVIALPNGNFVVSWEGQGIGDSDGAFVREFDSSGVPVDAELGVSLAPGSSVDYTTLVNLANNNFATFWSDFSGTDGSSWGVYQQLFGNSADFNRPASPVLEDVVSVRPIVQSTSSTPVRIDADINLTDADSANFDGGSVDVFFLTPTDVNDTLGIDSIGNGAGQIQVVADDVQYEGISIGTLDATENGENGAGLRVALNTNATAEAVEALLEHITYASVGNTLGDEYVGIRVTDGDGGVTGPVNVFIDLRNSVTPPNFLFEDVSPNRELNEADVNAGLVAIDDSVNFEYNGSNGLANGRLEVQFNGVSGNSGLHLDTLGVINQGTGTGQIGVSGNTVSFAGTDFATINATQDGQNGSWLQVDFGAAVTAEAVEALIEAIGFQTDGQAPVNRSVDFQVFDGAGAASSTLVTTLSFVQTPEGGPDNQFAPVLVNQHLPGNQTLPQAASLTDGSYVVTWVSENGQDGSSDGIYAQRFNAQGEALGNEFRVNSVTLGDQLQPSVTGLSDGTFVIVWSSSASGVTNGADIRAQRFDAEGNALGSEFLINNLTASTQNQARVEAIPSGGFAVIYTTSDSTSGDNSNSGIAMRQFDNAGVPQGDEVLINTNISNSQSTPDIAITSTAIMSVWYSSNGDDIQARIIDPADGSELVAEFRINTDATANTFTDPSVTALADGSFLVVWPEFVDEFAVNFWGFKGQRYGTDGSLIGDEFIVNSANTTWTTNDGAEVALLNNGNVMVTWGTNAGVYAQQFDVSGTTPTKVDGPVLAGNGPSTDHQATVVAVGANSAAVIWSGFNLSNPTNSSYEIGQQIIGPDGDIARQSAPFIAGLASEITLLEDSAPQLLIPFADVLDADSTNFDGGSLWLNVISGYGGIDDLPESATQDNWGVFNEGTGAGQIGVSGSTVTFGGTAIGSIVSDGQGGNGLQIDFNANASADAINALLQNLTYANSSDGPIAQRQVALRISDGDGGTNIGQTLLLNVVPVIDGAMPQAQDYQVNSFEPGNQTNPSMVALADGGYVVVWASENGQDGNSGGIVAQRFAADGTPVGNEIQVNEVTLGNQFSPSVTALGTGFVIAWQDSSGQQPDGSGSGIYGQRFDADGLAIGSQFLINDTTLSTQADANLTETSGGFAAVWSGNGSGDNTGVYLRLFNDAGVALGAEILVNEDTSGGESEAEVTELSNGNLAVTWRDNSGTDSVRARLFDNAGAPLGNEFILPGHSGQEFSPTITGLSGGGFVVVYTNDTADGSGWGTFAQLYDNSGNVQGDAFRVNEATAGSQYQAEVTATTDGGFAVAFYTDNFPDRIITQQFNASGERVDNPIVANIGNVSTDQLPTITGLLGGGFAVAWQGYNLEDSAANTYGIFVRNFGAVDQFSDNIGALTFAGLTAQINLDESDTAQLLWPAIDLNTNVATNFDGGSLWLDVIAGYGAATQVPGGDSQDNWGIQNEGVGVGDIGVSGSNITFGGTVIGTLVNDGQAGNGLRIDFNANADLNAVNALIQNLTYLNTSNGPTQNRTVSLRVNDGNGVSSVNTAIELVINPVADGAEPQGNDIQVNTFEVSNQTNPEITTLDDGSFVVVWQSTGQDGWAEGIVGQRFDASGAPVGNEFIVNDYTPTNQILPSAAAVNGGFVVAWHGRGESDDNGVFGRIFDANGVPLGQDFNISDTLASGQDTVRLTSLSSGGFAAVWDGNGVGDNSSTFLRLFDATGNPTSAEILVDENAGSTQYAADITELSDGKLAVTWADTGNPDSVYVRLFNSDGSAATSQFVLPGLVGEELQPAITALNGGGFVVVYTNDRADGSGAGVFAQLYDNAGNTVGSEFRVNENNSGTQNDAQVVATADGGFAVAFYSSQNPDRIITQQFDANGNRVDSNIVTNVGNASTDWQPAITALQGGGLATVWSGFDLEAGTDNTYGIFMRLFGTDDQFNTSQAPIVELASTQIDYVENELNFAPQALILGAGVADIDSANFDGGQLEISRISSYGQGDQLGRQPFFPQDNLGIFDQGTGAGQIGISGTNVTYSGTVIGTLDSNGANDTPLVVTFNANASAQAVEALLEAVNYRNTSDAPEASRTFSVRLTDGDGGASGAQSIAVNISQSLDGNVPTLNPERIVNETLSGSQRFSSVSALTDETSGELVGYVVVWDDTSTNTVRGRIYDADNNPSSEFTISQSVGGNDQPVVQALPNGTFIVTWYSSGVDGSGDAVLARIYNNDGSTTTSEAHGGDQFAVNTTTSGSQFFPDVAVLDNGDFMVVWSDSSSNLGDSGTGIIAQRFDVNGNSIGGEFLVNTFTSSTQSHASVSALAASTALPSGGYVVTWESFGVDGSNYGVSAQVYDHNGNAVGTELAVNTFTLNTQQRPVVAGLVDGGFVIAWDSEDGQDLSGNGIYAQRFGFDGSGLPTPIGSEFRASDNYVNSQYQPSIVGTNDGGFAIAYTDNSNSNNIYLQEFDAAGQLIDRAQLVNQNTTSTQLESALGALPNGGFLLSWSSFNSPNSYDIQVQRFENAAPVITEFNVQGNEDESITIDANLFVTSFDDPEGEPLQSITIVTLPLSGEISFNGAPVSVGQQIDIADLLAGSLTYLGNQHFNGIDPFTWSGSDGVQDAPPVQSNIIVLAVNDAPALDVGLDDTGTEGSIFSHQINLGDPDGDTFSFTIDWGDGSALQNISTSQTTFNINHFYADNGDYTVTVNVDDQAGQANSQEQGTFNVTIGNVAPNINLFGDNTVEVDNVYSLTLGNPSDPGDDTVDQYVVDWGDGTTDTYTAAEVAAAGRVVTHTYTEINSFDITIDLRDEDGTYLDVTTKPIDVSAPVEIITVDAGLDATLNEGSLFSRLVTFTDPTDQDPNGWNYEIDWGDGTVQTGLRTFDGDFGINHIFADNGTYTVTVTVSDDQFNQVGSDTIEVTVDDVAPVFNFGGTNNANEGSPFTLLGSVFDPGDETISSYVIDWGDGTVETVLGADIGTPQHTYADGPFGYTITVDVVNEDGTFAGAGSRLINVNNVAPSSSISGPTEFDEGTTQTFTFGAITDPGDDTITATIIDWGDGTTEPYTGAGDYSHTFNDGTINPFIRLLVTDEDGVSQQAAGLSVLVNDVSPSVTIGGALAVNEGATYTLNLFNLVEPGNDTVTEYLIDWGDGSPVQSVPILGNGDVNVDHIFADGADNHTIAVSIVNDDGTFPAGTLSVTVNNVAPETTATGADTTIQNTPYTLTLGAIVDPGEDTIVTDGITVNWGDGTIETFSSVGDITHTYATTGNFTISVSLEDEDGLFNGVATKAVTVNGPASTVDVAAQGDANINEGDTLTRTINFTDGEDNGTAGWTVDIDWDGDGNVDQSLVTTDTSVDISNTFADGDASSTVSVTVSDEAGESDTESFTVNVENVAPTAAISGNSNVDEGSTYTLTLGDIVDPGDDTVTDAVINWGDGDTTPYTGAGDYDHIYPDGQGIAAITLEVTDEDSTFIAASLDVVINNVVPQLTGDCSISWGDPHLTTFDGLQYDFQGAGEFTLVGGTNLEIQVRQEPWNANNATVNTAVAAQMGADIVGIYLERPNEVNINGVFVPIADFQTIEFDGGVVYREGNTFIVANDQGEGFEANLRNVYINVEVCVDGTARADNIAGLMGDFDGNRLNDLQLEDGTVLSTTGLGAQTLYGDYAESWRATPETTLFFYNPGENFDTFNLPGFPQTPLSLDDFDPAVIANAEAIALAAGLTPGTYEFDSAVFDVALTGLAEFATSAAEDVTPFDGETSVVELDFAPEAQDDNVVTEVNTQVVIDVLANDSDPENLALSVVSASDDIGGELTIVSNQLVYTPPVDFIGTATINYTIEDIAGNQTSAVARIAVSSEVNVAAQADANINEGDTFTRTINFTDGEDNGESGWTVDIDWDGDGNADQSFTTTNNSFEISNTFDDGDAASSVTVTVTDEAGESDSESFTVNVANVAPTAAISGNSNVDEGSTYTLTLGDIVDPGDDTITNAVINWGDGTSTIYTGAGDYDHIFADGNASPTIELEVTDEDGTYTAASLNIVVNDVAPSLLLTGADNVDEGSLYTLTLSNLVEPGDDSISEYLIDWGDGSPVQSVASLGDHSHTFVDGDDNHTISVSIVNEDGTFPAGTLDVAVNNVAPETTATGADTTIQNTLYTLTLGAIVDPGDDTIIANGITVDWGDGTVETFSSVGDITHTYATTGDFTISVSLEDEDGLFSDVATKAVTVNAPTTTVDIAAQADANINEGDTFTRTINFTDGEDNGAAGWTVDIDWDGDGNADQSFTTSDTSVDISNTFADGDAAPTVSVTITDEAGESDTESFTVNVANVAPTIALSGDASVEQGSTYTLTLGDIVDPGDDTLVNNGITVDWGDGTIGSFNSVGDITHSYATSGNFTISVSLEDEDGNFADVATKNVTVEDSFVPPTGTGSMPEFSLRNNAVTLDLAIDSNEPITEILVDWGDGSPVASFPDTSALTHEYAELGLFEVSVQVVTDSGTFDLGIIDNIDVGLKVGEASPFLSFFDPLGWQNSWTTEGLAIEHKMQTDNTSEAWTPASFVGFDSWHLPGQDIALGDLGVSGRSSSTSPVFQELDGTEALRISLTDAAFNGSLALTNLYANEGAGLHEAARIQLLAEDGSVVDEVMVLGEADGIVEVSFATNQAFSYVVFNAGAYDGTNFIYGSYADDNGEAAAGALNTGSDFYIDYLQFGYRRASDQGGEALNGVANIALSQSTQPQTAQSQPDSTVVSKATDASNAASNGASNEASVETSPEKGGLKASATGLLSLDELDKSMAENLNNLHSFDVKFDYDALTEGTVARQQAASAFEKVNDSGKALLAAQHTFDVKFDYDALAEGTVARQQSVSAAEKVNDSGKALLAAQHTFDVKFDYDALTEGDVMRQTEVNVNNAQQQTKGYKAFVANDHTFDVKFDFDQLTNADHTLTPNVELVAKLTSIKDSSLLELPELVEYANTEFTYWEEQFTERYDDFQMWLR